MENEELENEGGGLTDEELDRLSLARVIERGLSLPGGSAPPPAPAGETIGTTGIRKPSGYDLMDYQEQLSYVAEETKKSTLAEAKAQAEKAATDANASILSELKELKTALSGTLAPVVKGQVVEKVASQCSAEARPFVEKAIAEAEERYKSGPLSKVSDNEAWLLAGRAEALYASSKVAAAPTVVYAETVGVPETGANKQATEWLSYMKKVAPNAEFTYAEALEAIKENANGV